MLYYIAGLPDLSGFTSVNLPTINQPPVVVTGMQDFNPLTMPATTDNTINSVGLLQLLNSQATLPGQLASEPGVSGMNQTQGQDKSLSSNPTMVFNYDSTTFSTDTMNKLLQDVDQLNSTNMLGNMSFNFAGGDFVLGEDDPGVAAHENVTSSEDQQMVSDPQLNAQLLEVRKQLSSLNQPQQT